MVQGFGHVPHVAPEAWFHFMFAPISDHEICQLENDIEIKFLDVFKDFLALANGLSIFSGSLSVYGFRNSWQRDGDDAWQPFSIITSNTAERPADSKRSFLFVGGYPSGNGFARQLAWDSDQRRKFFRLALPLLQAFRTRRNPCSVRERKVVFSLLASRWALSKRSSAISIVVFIMLQPTLA
jgi:hypothetical protein